jgi:hypothetical protein
MSSPTSANIELGGAGDCGFYESWPNMGAEAARFRLVMHGFLGAHFGNPCPMPSGNTTNSEIASLNKVGVIVSPSNSGAISRSTGGAGVGTTDPSANISY